MRVYLDTNVVYLFLRPPAAGGPLEEWLVERRQRLARGDDEAVVSPLVLDELAYRLLIAALKDAGHPEPLRAIRSEPDAAVGRHGERVAEQVAAVMSLPGLEVAGVDRTVAARALGHMVAWRLLPRDAAHLALAQQAACDAIASLDGDFARSAEVVAWVGPPVPVAAPVG